MLASSIRWRPLAVIALAASFINLFSVSTYAQKPKITKVKPQPANTKKSDEPSVEPDKVLYDRAMKDMKLRRYIEARLDLQTLINTYPDSEFLAKAKLAVADSFYREGSTSNFTQAIEEYKNFIVFFPFLEESAYAQMQVAMAHYRMMEKSDRDNSQAQDAESEFQIFLKKYPDSPLRAQAEQYLRNVQEVIADGEFRIGRFYYVRAHTNPADYPAAAARLVDVSQRYPLYSQTDEALWMLADVYERAKRFSKNEDDKNHWSDLASQCYSRIVTEYPLSKFAPDSKTRLQGMGKAVPATNAEAAARMEKDRAWEKQHHNNAALVPLAAFRGSPNMSAAARAGDPNPNPPDDAVSATAVLKQGAAGPSFGLEAQGSAADSGDSSNGTGAPNIIEGSAAPTDSSSEAPTTGVGVQIIEAPSGPTPGASGTGSTESSSSSSPPPSGAEVPTATLSNADPSSSGTPVTATPAPAGTATIIDETPAAAASPATQATAPTVTGSSQSASAAAAPASTAPAADSTKESTSKKKKGLHKLNPF